MSALSLVEADRLYRLAGTRAIRYHRVDHALFRTLDFQARRWFRRIGDAGQDDDVWRPFVSMVARYRRALIGSPLAFSDPAVASSLNLDQAERFVARIRPMYPGLANEAEMLLQTLRGLTGSPESPLLDVVDGILTSGRGSEALLIRDSRMVGTVHDRVAARGHSRVDVLAGREVRSAGAYDSLVIVGPAYWYADHVFSAPRAAQVELVSYRWFKSQWRPGGGFVGPISGTRTDRYDDEEEGAEVEEPWPEIDWGRIMQREGAPAGSTMDASAPDSTEARLFSLHGGLAVFLEEEEGARSLVIDLEAEDEGRVQRMLTRDVGPGMFVLLRTEGGGDYVAAVADQILAERAAECRRSQMRWKHALRAQIRTAGLLATSVRLLDLGSVRANEANVRHWASESSIHARDRADFWAMMRLSGLEDEADQYWTAMEQIRHAHLLAGQRIRKRLLEQVRATDIHQIETTGRLDFMLPDAEGGRLSALRVEARSPMTYEVPASRIGRPFDVED